MSGKYLHGLIIDGDYVDVRDNIFSHSELRQKWTGSESEHKLIQKWAWDYVTREFCETPADLIPIAEKWIKKNLNSHVDLILWVDKNWEGLVNGDEKERELYIWGLIDNKAKHKNKLVQSFLKANADKSEAYAAWSMADAAWSKAYAAWSKANAAWSKANKAWKTKAIKPVFMELLQKFPNKYWRSNA